MKVRARDLSENGALRLTAIHFLKGHNLELDLDKAAIELIAKTEKKSARKATEEYYKALGQGFANMFGDEPPSRKKPRKSRAKNGLPVKQWNPVPIANWREFELDAHNICSKKEFDDGLRDLAHEAEINLATLWLFYRAVIEGWYQARTNKKLPKPKKKK